MSNSAFVKNIIAKSLGILWIIDGLLQFQPLMFGQDFINTILTPLLSNQPSFLHALIAFGIWAWGTNTVITNSLAALLQISIGIFLLFPLSDMRFKMGAYTSIVWGLIVWVYGEGAGLLLTGSASFYLGAPGAVLFYVLLAALLLIPEKIEATLFTKIAGWTFIVGSLLQLQPIFWTSDGVRQIAMASTTDPFHALTIFPTYISNILALQATTSNTLLIAIPLCIGIALLIKPNRITGTIALVFLFLTWWVGQDFGLLSTLFTGTPTDPQLSPVLALFLVPLFIKR